MGQEELKCREQTKVWKTVRAQLQPKEKYREVERLQKKAEEQFQRRFFKVVPSTENKQEDKMISKISQYQKKYDMRYSRNEEKRLRRERVEKKNYKKKSDNVNILR